MQVNKPAKFEIYSSFEIFIRKKIVALFNSTYYSQNVPKKQNHLKFVFLIIVWTSLFPEDILKSEALTQELNFLNIIL